MTFHYRRKVLFRDCDPAGIAFYPRLVEMVNDAVEALFDQALDWPFERLLTTHGAPTARLSLRFVAPCRHGEHLVITVAVARLGRSSLDLDFAASCDGASRFTAASTVVLTGPDGRSTPWPDPIRAALTALKTGEPT